jgi:hypothetical protein
MRSVVLAVLASLALAPAALADTATSDSPRDPGLPASQDLSNVTSTIDPAAGTWTIAFTLYGAPSSSAWGNLNAALYTGPSQCADPQAEIASFQQTPTIPGDQSVFASVIPASDRQLRVPQSKSKAFDGDTITLSMTDSSLVGAAPTCVLATLSHNRVLDEVGPIPFAGAPAPAPTPTPTPAPPGSPAPPPKLAVAVKSTHLRASSKGVVKVALKPFNQAASGVVTLREGGKQVGRASYRAKQGAGATVSIKLSAAARRSLKRHRSLSVTVTATAQAGTQVVTKAVRARVRP